MKTVSARQANHDFSELLSRVERGEEILITKRSQPVAFLSPYRLPRLTPERQAAIDHAIEVMAQGLPWGSASRAFTRDEMAGVRFVNTFHAGVFATISLPLEGKSKPSWRSSVSR